MSKEDKEKKVPVDGQEDFILKKIRYYQGTIDDYETFWNKKTAEGEKEECPETKAIKKKNDDLNRAFEIIPVEKDDTVICKDVVSGKDKDETPKENPDAQPVEDKEGDKTPKEDSGLEQDPNNKGVETSEKSEKKEKKKEKKEEKHEEEEEVKEKDEKKEEKGDDDDDEKKKKKKEDKY